MLCYVINSGWGGEMPGGSPLFWCSSPARGGSPLFWCSSPRPLALAQYKVKSRRVLLFPRVAAAGHWLAAERLLAGRWPFAADSTASSTRSRCHCLRTRSTAAGQQGDGRCCGATCTTSRCLCCSSVGPVLRAPPPCRTRIPRAGARFGVGSAILDYGRTSAQDGQA